MIVHEIYVTQIDRSRCNARIEIITSDETARIGVRSSIPTLFTQANWLTDLSVEKRHNEPSGKQNSKSQITKHLNRFVWRESERERGREESDKVNLKIPFSMLISSTMFSIHHMCVFSVFRSKGEK